MKFTIGTASSSLGFEEDLKLIKSSLLYADEIELIGMAEYAVFKYLPECIGSVKNIDTLVDAFVPLLKSVDVEGTKKIVQELEEVKTQVVPYKAYLNKKKCRTKQEILAQMKIEKTIEASKLQLVQEISEFTETPTANEIRKLISEDIVSVFDYECKDFSIDALAGGYFGNLLGTMQNNTAYPLFDENSNNVISSFAQSKILDLGNINQEVLVHAGVATNILMTLPTLDAASIDEILDFKKEMQVPLINFRKAIYGFSEKVESRPWDKDFQYDCLKIYSTEVAPKVEELNELSSQTSVLKNMGRRVLADEEFRKKASWATGGLVTTITTSSNMMGALDVFKNWIVGLSLFVVAPNAMSAFLKTLNVRAEAKEEVKSIEKDITSNTMYYYYCASKNL